MKTHALALADQARVSAFGLLGATWRLWKDYSSATDVEGLPWAVVHLSGHCFGVPALGPGWVFDPYAREFWRAAYDARRQELEETNPAGRATQLAKAVRGLRLGRHAERLLWSIHTAVLVAGSSVVRLPDFSLATALWGNQAWPRAWRQEILEVLQSLAWLHLAAGAADGAIPHFGSATALLTHVDDLRGDPEQDQCDPTCPAWEGGKHHHYVVNIGRGFLGVLEQFLTDDSQGVRRYGFANHTHPDSGPTLHKVGQGGQLVSLYVPAKLGTPEACARLSGRQQRLLQAIVRETTRTRKKRSTSAAESGVWTGHKILDFYGRRLVACPLLNKQARHTGFNGNLKKTGYRLATPGGWLSKAGYSSEEVTAFLEDLSELAAALSLTVVGVSREQPCWHSLPVLRGLGQTPAGRSTLERLHLRIYAAEDYLNVWNRFFHWEPSEATASEEEAPLLTTAKVLDLLQERQLTRRQLATGLSMDHSFVSKVLSGKKPVPANFLVRAQAYLDAAVPAPVQPVAAPIEQHDQDESTPESMLAAALTWLQRGWAIVPQEPRAKKPYVRWKAYQDELPTPEQIKEWWRQWPDAGLALVLGPVSGVFVIDVDGPEAHAALRSRLQSEPLAPKALSGSGKPCRYHLFFRCPSVATKAKQTPWHPQLEFRGKGGIIIIPPSQHKSGQRYAWAPGRAPTELALPAVPAAVLQALTPVPAKPSASRPGRPIKPVTGVDASPRTLRFLSGAYSEGPQWNDRLFRAACDLCGRDLPLEKAEPLLLAGARPWTSGEEELARRTIQSAYSKSRVPGEH